MKKKIFLSLACLLSVVSLAACSGKNDDEIATMKGGKITVQDFYDKAKTDQNSQQIVLDMIISQVFTEKYGDKVSDKDVQKQIKNSFGDEKTFKAQLKAANMSQKEVEENIKQSLALQEGLKAHVKLTDKDLKTAWESYHPEVSAQIIALTSEDDAKDVKKQVDKKDADFGKIAKKNSIDDSKDDNGEVKFDSTSTTIPDEVKEAAWEMKNDEISDPIEVNTGYGVSYYIIKMNKTQDKGNDMSKYEKKIKKIANDTKLNDQEFTMEVIGKELKEANVKIKDDAFSSILTQFTEDSTTDSTADSTADSSK